MCGRVEHYVAAVGHGAVASLFAFGMLPSEIHPSPTVRVTVAVLMAAATVPMSGGKYSPDIDQFGVWKRADRWIPDELLGFGGPMAHRRLMHWWGIPGAATAGLWAACHHLPLPAAVLLLALAWMPVAGWWSHLLSDYVIGARYLGGRRPEADDPAGQWDRKSMLDADDSPRGPGIPLLPWTVHIGCGWKVGSVQEWLYVFAMVAAGVGAVYGSWRGVVLPWDGRVAVVVLVVAIGWGLRGWVRFRRRLAQVGRRPARAGVAS